VAAETAVQLTVALLEVMDEDARPPGATQGTNVVNCAATKFPLPALQVALTLQSYKLPVLSPVKLAVVVV
jgi:hypothetical protein